MMYDSEYQGLFLFEQVKLITKCAKLFVFDQRTCIPFRNKIQYRI